MVVSDLKEIKRQWLTTNLSVISSRFVETDVDEDEVIQYYGIYRSRDNGKRVTHIHPDLVGYIKKLDI
ncbi:MAG: hypothetical protein H6767_03590 [Candidatus Peribacteria bacterium]|nr:MAG: hypothetical protein H6767_03590 [Candidatus Peribacteria bacterium]